MSSAGCWRRRSASCVRVAVDLGGGGLLQLFAGRALELRVIGPDQVVGQLEDPVPVLRRGADQLADHLQGEWRRDLGDEVGGAALTAWLNLVEQRVADLLDVRFEPADHPRREPPVDERPLPGVLRRVHVQHHQPRHGQRFLGTSGNSTDRRDEEKSSGCLDT